MEILRIENLSKVYGKTFKEIRTLCPNSEISEICEGMNIVFESYSDKLVTKEQDIENWIKTL